jgi:glycosyltransferase involved in cell wall biosynthesis
VPFFVIAQLKTQIEELVKLGALVTIVSSNGSELLAGQPIACANWKTIEIARSIHPLKDLLALMQLYWFFRQTGIQIAHSTTPKAGLLTAIAGKLAGVPVRLHTFTGQPWVTMHGIKRWVVRGCDRLIGKLNTACYADSASQREFLIASAVLRPDRIRVIGAGSLAGVDVERFNTAHFPEQRCQALRESLGIPQRAAVLLFVGRITAEKGVRELMQAFDGLKRTVPNAHLVMVGEFEDEQGLADRITPEEISQHQDTHIVGYTPCPEAYMAIADVLCLPSYREGFGTVVIEAASMGLPAVGTQIYGLSDAVQHGQTGLLVAPRDSLALQTALQTLLGDDALRLRMGNLARERARGAFDSRRVNAAVVCDYAAHLSRLAVANGSKP